MSDILVTVSSDNPVVTVVGQQGPAGPPVPAGTATRVLFSDATSTGVDTSAVFTFNKATGTLLVTTAGVTTLSAGGTVSANALISTTSLTAASASVSGTVAANALTTTTSINAGTTIAATGALSGASLTTTGAISGVNGSFSGTLGVTGATTLSSTLSVGNNLTFATDNANDLGAAAASRPRIINVGSRLVVASGNAGSATGLATDIHLAPFLGGVWLNTPTGTAGRLAAANNEVIQWTATTVTMTQPVTGPSFTTNAAFSATVPQINLNGATGNWINWNQNGVAAPSFTTRSAGTKAVLFPAITASTFDWAIGIDSGTTWFTNGAAAGNGTFKFYFSNNASVPSYEFNTAVHNFYNNGFANTATNNEYGGMRWASNVFEIFTANNGTGTKRSGVIDFANITFRTNSTNRWGMTTTGHFVAINDNTNDIGEPGVSRPRTVYVGTGVVTRRLSQPDAGINLDIETVTGTSINFNQGGTLRWVVCDGANNTAIRPWVDNTYDIGLPGTRVRSGYFGTSVTTPNVVFPAAQVASADPNTLDDYEEGTYTPSLTFANGSAGITYASRSGHYRKIGDTVFFRMDMTLSSKGSSTGGACISLPSLFVSLPGVIYVYACQYSNTSGVTSTLFARLPDIFVLGPSGFSLQTENGGFLTDANFTNTTTISVCGFFQAQ